MPYMNELIFFAGFGVLCLLVVAIYILLVWLITIAANAFNEKIMAFGLLARNAHALVVLKRINQRKRFYKTGLPKPILKDNKKTVTDNQ